MTIDWQSPKVEKPPQGTKILWFTRGDVFVAQRFGNKYLCLQPGEATVLKEPQLWALCSVPEPYTGKVHIKMNDSEDFITIDEMEKKYPKQYREFVKEIRDDKIEQ